MAWGTPGDAGRGGGTGVPGRASGDYGGRRSTGPGVTGFSPLTDRQGLTGDLPSPTSSAQIRDNDGDSAGEGKGRRG